MRVMDSEGRTRALEGKRLRWQTPGGHAIECEGRWLECETHAGWVHLSPLGAFQLYKLDPSIIVTVNISSVRNKHCRVLLGNIEIVEEKT